ncbi:MAG: thioredoxin [Bacteroidota bacterium]
MKKSIKTTPVLMILFAAVIIGSNFCCTGNASSNGNSAPATNTEATALAENTNGVITLTEKTFDAQIKKGVTLVDFWAPWCRPCKMQLPINESVSAELAGKAAVCKIDIDQNNSIADRYNVQSIPTMILFKDGKVVGQFVGVTDKETLLSEIKKHLK